MSEHLTPFQYGKEKLKKITSPLAKKCTERLKKLTKNAVHTIIFKPLKNIGKASLRYLASLRIIPVPQIPTISRLSSTIHGNIHKATSLQNHAYRRSPLGTKTFTS